MTRDSLIILENAAEYYVAYASDNEDWVAKFAKSWPQAKIWAQRMVDAYNQEHFAEM